MYPYSPLCTLRIGTEMVKPQSKIGMTSFILFFCPWIGLVTFIATVMLPDVTDKQINVVGIMALPLVGLAPLVGLGLGIASLCSSRKSRKWGAIGLAGNTCTILFLVLVILTGEKSDPEWEALWELTQRTFEFKEEHDRWPESLAELPDQSLVSFQGTNFVYDPTNYVLSSLREPEEYPDILHKVTRGRYGNVSYSRLSVHLPGTYEAMQASERKQPEE